MANRLTRDQAKRLAEFIRQNARRYQQDNLRKADIAKLAKKVLGFHITASNITGAYRMLRRPAPRARQEATPTITKQKVSPHPHGNPAFTFPSEMQRPFFARDIRGYLLQLKDQVLKLKEDLLTLEANLEELKDYAGCMRESWEKAAGILQKNILRE